MPLEWLRAIFQRLSYANPPPALPQMSTGSSVNNHLMVQFFEWDSVPPEGKSWWRHFQDEIPELAQLGCTQVWLPPPNKAMEKIGRGYDAYDLVRLICAIPSLINEGFQWDLGEFDQKGSVSTRWGTKEEFLACVRTAKENGIDILLDAVLNHKLGADRRERFPAVEVDPLDRRTEVGKPREIEGWTAFDFPGRGDKYSSMKWTQEHFTGLDWDHLTKKSAIYKIIGKGHKGWSNRVDAENGNYDYLLGIDIDFRHPAVRADLLAWGPWVINETGAAGFRLDACKHMDRDFLREFVKTVRKQQGHERMFVVAEFWIDSVVAIERYIKQLNAPVSMFDVPLHYNFHRASTVGPAYDLREILNGSLVSRRPGDSVTFVDNHDTAIGCSLESWVGKDFKLVAYALILLRAEGHPCVYHADLYGPDAVPGLKLLMIARNRFAYGHCSDYFTTPNCIGFMRHGDTEHTRGCIVLCANGGIDEDKLHSIEFEVPRGSRWKNIIPGAYERLICDSERASFPCPSNGVSLWCLDNAGTV